jgi:hypothetical protein
MSLIATRGLRVKPYWLKVSDSFYLLVSTLCYRECSLYVYGGDSLWKVSNEDFVMPSRWISDFYLFLNVRFIKLNFFFFFAVS